MCKQYVYFSLCLEHDCEFIVGKKGRNTYCRAARHGARRLGSCDGGIEYVVIGRHRGTVSCGECKQLKALRQLYVAASKSAIAIAAVGDGGDVSTTEPEDVRSGDDGEAWSDDYSSDGENIEKDDNTEPLRFFANRKAKAEKLTSAYDFDLAVQQEISVQNVKALFSKSQGDDRLCVVSDRDDSTIEYEEKVPEYIRHKEPQTPMEYYGFEPVVTEERKSASDQKRLSMCGALGQMRDAQHHPDDTVFDSAATTTATLDSESDGEMEINSDLNMKLIKESFIRSVVDTASTNPRRRIKPKVARVTEKRGDGSASSSDDGKETEENKTENSLGCGKGEYEDAGSKTSGALPSSFGFVCADGGKRRRTC